jgi:hypothetical protein
MNENVRAVTYIFSLRFFLLLLLNLTRSERGRPDLELLFNPGKLGTG